MATKKNELNVDEILGSYEPSTKSKETKTTKQSNTDWAEEEEENYAFGIAKEQAASKKTQKKKAAGKGWAEVEAAQQTQVKTQDFSKIQEDEQKRKIIKKPGQGRATTGVELGAEAFPSLGEAPTKPAPKKNPEPTPVITPADTNDGFSVVGARKFTNTKKKEAGEHFAPLDPNIVEKPVPVAPVREKVESTSTSTTAEPSQAALPRGIFQRKTADQQPPAEIPADTKFKFGGGEGPKKFSAGSKISFKREEEKDDHEALRLQREREIEEKIQREKEELAKQRENREKKFAAKEGGAPGEHQGHEERKRFTNPKKEAEKPPVVAEVLPQETETKPKESVEMHGALSNKAWGDGPILKKPQKK